MKIRIKLANGIEINKEFTAEQLQKAEQSKQFKKAEKSGIKYQYCNHYRAMARENNRACAEYCRNISRCAEQYHKRADLLSSYINYLQTI